jgi:membrane protein implicated in regulation of membrane protease activity
MLRLILIVILIATELNYLIHHPRVIKTPPVFLWMALTIISILFLFNPHTLPFSLPLQTAAFLTLWILIARKKAKRQKKWPRRPRPPQPRQTTKESRADRIIKKIISP